ncbi:hypothetical protein IKG05_01840 [Candidatus Saccharibacteria bacterium]|nr:hypothetical protein [Candidatus Saccharibacteria bacterium]
MKIVIPELQNPTIQEAIADFPTVEFLPADNLEQATAILMNGQADSMLSGLDYSSRDVLLAYKASIPVKSRYFSSCFVCQKGDQIYALADGGVNKLPTKEQLYTIVEDTARTYQAYTSSLPMIAMLSYSTNGSGGKNPDLDRVHYVVDQIRKNHPDWLIDGEMQLDAAIDPAISAKKFPTSQVQGRANILIAPDLNSGNILYKAMERFGGFVVAGPIIQGFAIPLADLSRGSTANDVRLTLDVLIKQIKGVQNV